MTKFLPFTDKLKLRIRAEKGDSDASLELINEIDRLERIIKNYEASFESILYQYKSQNLKSPKKVQP